MMLGRFVLLALGLALIGCSDRNVGDDELAASDSTGADAGDASTGTGETSSGSSDTSSTSTTDPTGSDSSDSGESSPDAGSDASSSDASSSDASDGPLDEVTYVAEAYVGQVDRVFIYRLDPFTDTCAKISLAQSFSANPQFDVVTPTDWSLEYVRIWAGLDCEASPGQGLFAVSGTGSVQFNDYDPMLAIFPCDIDVSAEFTFEDNPPTMVGFDVIGLVPTDMISGC